jgi:hypothetical protein
MRRNLTTYTEEILRSYIGGEGGKKLGRLAVGVAQVFRKTEHPRRIFLTHYLL